MSDDVDISKLDISDEMIAERRSATPDNLPEDMPGWMRRTIFLIDNFSIWTGRLVCWLLVPLMLAMVYEVVARKLFIAPTDWAYDVSRMVSGGMFMVGAAYALMRGVHIRADFIYRNRPDKYQGLVDATLYILFFFPAMIFFFLVSFDYASVAWIRWELSMDGAGSPGAHRHAAGRCTPHRSRHL